MKFDEIIIVIVNYIHSTEDLVKIEDYVYDFLELYTKPQLNCIFQAIEVKLKILLK